MNKLRTLAAAAMVAGGILLAAPLAYAEQAPDLTVSACLPGWYVNPDETDRKPASTEAGLEFAGDDLVHHAADLPLADLTPGTFVASVAPDQPSFFSVEVRNTGGAYGTLRWDTTTEKWVIVIGASADGTATAGTFTDADPTVLLTGKITKWGAFDPATAKVVSFGVGYTKSPPGTVPTVVTAVTFAGSTYSLACVVTPSTSSVVASPSQTVSPSPSPSATPPSTSPAASPSGSSLPPSEPATAEPTSSAPVGGIIPEPGGKLPLTGVAVPLMGGGGLALLAIGAGLLWYSRRRRAEFALPE